MQHFTGIQYLQIDIANQMSNTDDPNIKLDKAQFETRLAWVEQYEKDLEDLVHLADKSFQYLAAVMAYRDAQLGIPTGHLVGVDAAASGLQIMSALTGCQVTARNTGLIGPTCNDMYAICTKEMGLLLGEDVNVPRKEVKSAQMPLFYGSKQKPKDVFGDGTPEFYAFHEANRNVAPGACELLDIMLESWQPYALDHSWVMPDGFTVYVPVMVQVDTKIEVDELDHAAFVYRHDVNCGTEKGLSLAANGIHSIDGMVVRELSRRCNYDVYQLVQARILIKGELVDRKDKPHTSTVVPRIEKLAMDSGFISLVGVEAFNDMGYQDLGTEYLEHLLKLIEDTLDHKFFPLISVHDEFKAHANNINVVRQTYIDIMAEIAESDMLSHLLTQITGEYFETEKYSENLGELIREGEYAVS